MTRRPAEFADRRWLREMGVADPLAYFAAVVRHEIKPAGLASLAVNVIVVEILDAAHESARTGRQINF